MIASVPELQSVGRCTRSRAHTLGYGWWMCASFVADKETGPPRCQAGVAETAGAERFAGEACFAMHAGVASVPVSSGQTPRYRLNRRGNRRLNCALHRIAITQMCTHAPVQTYLERKRAQGKSKREALRCLKRHLARIVWRALRALRGGERLCLQPPSR